MISYQGVLGGSIEGGSPYITGYSAWSVANLQLTSFPEPEVNGFSSWMFYPHIFCVAALPEKRQLHASINLQDNDSLSAIVRALRSPCK